MVFYINFDHIILPFMKRLSGAHKPQKLLSSTLPTSLHDELLYAEFPCFFMRFNTWLSFGTKNLSHNVARRYNPFPALGVLHTCQKRTCKSDIGSLKINSNNLTTARTQLRAMYSQNPQRIPPSPTRLPAHNRVKEVDFRLYSL